MARQHQIPGYGYINETGARQHQLPGAGYVNETVSVGGGGSLIKTINGLAIASVKTINGLAIASVKTVGGLTNV